MNLEERTNQIFVELVNNPQITSKALCEKFDLTRGQLNYALKKINDSLVDEKLSEIKRTKNGHFLIANEILSNYKGVMSNSENQQKAMYFPVRNGWA